MTGHDPVAMRDLVGRGLTAIAPAVVEVLDQVDAAVPGQEPPDGTAQWTVSRRAYLTDDADVDDVLRRLRGAYASTDGWRTAFEDVRPPEVRVQVRRDEVTVTFAVAGGGAPQVVLTAVGARTRAPA